MYNYKIIMTWCKYVKMAGTQLQKTCKDNLLWRKRDKDYRVTKSEHFNSINVAGIILLGFFAIPVTVNKYIL